MPNIDLPSRGAKRVRGRGKPPGMPGFFSKQVSEARRFYLNLAPPPSERLAVVSGGCEHCTPDYVIDRARFMFYAIEFVAGGRGTLEMKGKRFALEAGTVFSYGPGTRHVITSDRRDPLVKYFLNYTGRRAVALLADGPLASHGPVHATSPGEIMSIMDDMIRNGTNGTGYSAKICEALLHQLAWKIAETAAQRGAIRTQSFATYRRCKQHFAERFRDLHSLDQAAAECHVDKAYLCRLFRRYDRLSPYQYLLRLKMNLAAERLVQPGIMVRQVADEMRFADAFHFSRVFKAAFGLSPRRFIALHREQEASGGKGGSRIGGR